MRVFKFLSSLIHGLKRKDSFIQNFAVIFSGKSIIFLIGFLLTPIIARIYDPEAYGTYAVYSSLVLNLSILSSLNLTNAFVVAKPNDFLPLLRSSFFLIFSFSLVVMIVFFLFGGQIFALFNKEILSHYWYLIPLGVFLTASCNLMGHWNVREKAFRMSTIVSISETLGTKTASVSIGILTNGTLVGLVLGELIGKVMLIITEVLLILKKRIALVITGFRFRSDISVIRNYKDYPILLLPSLWLNQATSSVVIFFLAIFFSSDLVGSYTMAASLLMIPVMLIANAAQPVLMQKIVELKASNENHVKSVEKFVFSLSALLFIPIVSIVIVGPPIIRVFLGSTWEQSAELVAILSPLVLFNLLIIPLNGVLIALNKNRQILIINSLRFSISLIVVFVSWSLGLGFIDTILFIVLLNVIGSTICIFFALRTASVFVSRRLLFLLISYVAVFVFLFRITDLI